MFYGKISDTSSRGASSVVTADVPPTASPFGLWTSFRQAGNRTFPLFFASVGHRPKDMQIIATAKPVRVTTNPLCFSRIILFFNERANCLTSTYNHSSVHVLVGGWMPRLKLTKLEMQVLKSFWRLGAASVREVLETFPANRRPAYTTIQTVVFRLERKKALRCVKKISNARIFEAAITPEMARRPFMDDVLTLFGIKGLMSHLVESGDLTLVDLREAEDALR